MHFIDEIEENTLLIVPNTLKTKVLKYINSLDKLINVKIFDFNEIKKHLFFDYIFRFYYI